MEFLCARDLVVSALENRDPKTAPPARLEGVVMHKLEMSDQRGSNSEKIQAAELLHSGRLN